MYLYSPGFSRLPQITSMARFSPWSVANRRNSRPGDRRLRAYAHRAGRGSAIRCTTAMPASGKRRGRYRHGERALTRYDGFRTAGSAPRP
jgi:hypothetical protein